MPTNRDRVQQRHKDTTMVLANPAHAKQTPALANSRPLIGLLHPHNLCTIRHPFLATLLFVFATLTKRPPAQPTAKNGMTLLHSVAEPPSATLCCNGHSTGRDTGPARTQPHPHGAGVAARHTSLAKKRCKQGPVALPSLPPSPNRARPSHSLSATPAAHLNVLAIRTVTVQYVACQLRALSPPSHRLL